MLIDSALVIFSLWCANSLRFGEFQNIFGGSNWAIFVLLPAVTIVAAVGLGVYRWVVRSSTNRLGIQLVKVSAISSCALVFLLFMFPSEQSNPRSLFFLYGCVFATLSIGIRLGWKKLMAESTTSSLGEPIAIFGSGRAGQQLARLLEMDEAYRPTMFVDLDKSKAGTMVSGLPVYHAHDKEVTTHLRQHEARKIILAVFEAGSGKYQSMKSLAKQWQLPVQTQASIADIVTGTAAPDEIRDISVDDLLGRNPVPPMDKLLRQCVDDKVVLVTGGAGSIGSEICRQASLLNPKALIVLDQSEENLYRLSEEFTGSDRAAAMSNVNFVPVLGSVNDSSKVAWILSQYNVDTIYHVAAYKHVPIVEHSPGAGVMTNVFGTNRC